MKDNFKKLLKDRTTKLLKAKKAIEKNNPAAKEESKRLKKEQKQLQLEKNRKQEDHFLKLLQDQKKNQPILFQTTQIKRKVDWPDESSIFRQILPCKISFSLPKKSVFIWPSQFDHDQFESIGCGELLMSEVNKQKQADADIESYNGIDCPTVIRDRLNKEKELRIRYVCELSENHDKATMEKMKLMTRIKKKESVEVIDEYNKIAGLWRKNWQPNELAIQQNLVAHKSYLEKEIQRSIERGKFNFTK
jgi:hypothetical protein